MEFTVVVYQVVLRAVENNKSGGGGGGGGLRRGREGLDEKVVLDHRPKEAG